ncbi:radical SAM protein [Magnetovirga frankeli]|uniref:radical SAM protein n=1 Tax=Magnetovirga frankeli TaxID=947516 RepID=UPI001AF0331E|nr:radical SAM protein [gamma proteobacterium SS-5]
MLPKREKLADRLPLKTPFSVHIFPSYKCNFKCNYCIHAISNAELKKRGFSKDVMNFNTFINAIKGIKDYESRIKALIFAGHGEPLLHPDIIKMVDLAKKENIAERVEITTNASMLSKQMSDSLIDAGLDRLKISIQGTSEKKYKEISNHNLIYNDFIDNIKYFYSQKKHTEVYIKIIDIALKDKQDEFYFKSIFSSISDYIDIEYAIPFVPQLDLSLIKNNFDKCKQGHAIHSEICSMPFYMQVVTPNGDVLPCCSIDIPIVLGNVNNESLKQLWESEQQRKFLLTMLSDRESNKVCSRCSVPIYGLQEGDYLDSCKDKLLKAFENGAPNAS